MDSEDPSHVFPTLVKGYVACKRASLERSILRGVLVYGGAAHNVDCLLKRIGLAATRKNFDMRAGKEAMLRHIDVRRAYLRQHRDDAVRRHGRFK